MKAYRSPVAWYGGKVNLAKRIRAGFAPHQKFVETHAGSLAVLLASTPAPFEVANDLDIPLIDVYRALASQTDAFCDRLAATPYSQAAFDHAITPAADPLDRAVAFVVRNRMSYSSSGRSFQIDRMGRGGSDWLPYVAGLRRTGRRLAAVQFTAVDALDILTTHDGPDTLFYVDPPYLEETRSSDRHYAREMTPADHERLLKAANACVGHVYISGYRSHLYDTLLEGWHRVEWTVNTVMSGRAGKGRERTECLWARGKGGHTMLLNY